MVEATGGQGLKPTWRGLRRGGTTTPVREFVGRLARWTTNLGQWGTTVDLEFENVQVLATDAPYPYPELTISLKYSDQLNSVWGKFGESAARVLGVDMEYLDIDQLLNQQLHIIRRDDVQFGTNREGQPVRGTVWEILEVVAPGQVVTPQTSTQPTTPSPAPAATTAAAPTPATQAQVTPEQRALELLNGSDLATFFQKALPDPIIRQDGNLINQILTGAWIEAQKQAGKVKVNEDGTHTVVA